MVCMMANLSVAQILGDYNSSGQLDAGDLDLQALQMNSPNPDLQQYDLNNDGFVNFDDRKLWVEDRNYRYSWIGDANLDLEFNSSDMVQVYAQGKYEKDEYATWAEGDWDGSLKFDSSDMVAAFVPGAYERMR
jgi:hypothetical protein